MLRGLYYGIRAVPLNKLRNRLIQVRGQEVGIFAVLRSITVDVKHTT